MSDQPRVRVRALAQGRGDGRGIAVPLPLRVAARIQERDWHAFTHDPTELANGIRDLVDAVAPDGVPVTMPDIILSEAGPVLDRPVVVTALEAARRLRASMGDRVALVACLPGPGGLDRGADDLLGLGQVFLAAGVDVVAALGEHGGSSQLGTLANVARFHRAIAVGCCADQGLPTTVTEVPLADPEPTNGIVVSNDLPADIDLPTLADWITTVHTWPGRSAFE